MERVIQRDTHRLQHPVVAGDAEEAEADDEKARDGAAAECDVEGLAHAFVGGLRGAHVGAHADVHADITGRAREDGADQESDAGRPVQGEPEHDEEHDSDDADRRVLPVQVGAGAFLDRSGDFLHSRIAGRLLENPTDGNRPVNNGQYACTCRQQDSESARHLSSSRELT